MNFRFQEIYNNFDNELLERARSMEKICDFKDLDQPIAKMLENSGKYDFKEDHAKNLEEDKLYEIESNIYETDDNGNVYKKNHTLLPEITYEKNTFDYTTDNRGRISSWNGKPQYMPENERDEIAQLEAGGEDRQEGDDGGHLVARILGGSSGNENIVPMRDTVNRGDYKKVENEIAQAVKQGKNVDDSGEIMYEGDETRPSKIKRVYEIDGEKSVLKVDNVKKSFDLMEDFEENIEKNDLENLLCEIDDMHEDGCDVSITSILKKYDQSGNLLSIRVGIRNETDGEKTYKTYDMKKAG